METSKRREEFERPKRKDSRELAGTLPRNFKSKEFKATTEKEEKERRDKEKEKERERERESRDRENRDRDRDSRDRDRDLKDSRDRKKRGEKDRDRDSQRDRVSAHHKKKDYVFSLAYLEFSVPQKRTLPSTTQALLARHAEEAERAKQQQQEVLYRTIHHFLGTFMVPRRKPGCPICVFEGQMKGTYLY